MSEKRDLAATRRFFSRALNTTMAPDAWHHTEQYANNRIEAGHGRLKSRLWPMRGLKQLHSARVITIGHAFVQNLRRGHYELGIEEPPTLRVAAVFTELTRAI